MCCRGEDDEDEDEDSPLFGVDGIAVCPTLVLGGDADDDERTAGLGDQVVRRRWIRARTSCSWCI